MESKSSIKKQKKKNPYSNRGLEKFTTLVAELEEKRKRILSRNGSDNIALVRFVYKDSNNCVPVVVKTRNKSNNTDKDPKTNFSADNNSSREIGGQMMAESKKKTRRFYYYVPVAVLFIMFLLVFFGRSFVIICTSIMWYLIPTITGSDVNAKKKVSPRNSSCNFKDESSTKFCLRRKSW